MKIERDSCCAVSRGCEASPGSDHAKLRTECFSCGLAVCTAPGCSIRTEYYSYGQQRVCARCLEQRFADTPFLRAALEKLYAREAIDDGHLPDAVPDLVKGHMGLLAA